ncbi:MAG: Hsp20/alpha crystallin family protein [Candidatus Pacebacteria bacterium]|nr:Hsp20/alpha crystallin family protein [Candidatus Paceibacterota bacterium]
MAITPWKPFSDLDKFLSAEFRIREPAMDIYEDNGKVIAEFNLPELDPNKTEITLRNNVLTVKGSTEEKEEKREENYVRREIKRGYFERSVTLPKSVKEDYIEASYEKGILKIEMQKEVETPQKKIDIKIKG